MIDEAASIVCGRCGGALGHSPDECDRILTATEEEKLRDRAERAERNFKDLRIESRNNIDALRAELAERTREQEEWRQSAFDRAARCVGQSDMIDILTRELAAERERREAAEKDAARYRWLRGDAPTHSERWPRWNLQRWDGRCWHSLERGALDAAIDAAMSKD